MAAGAYWNDKEMERILGRLFLWQKLVVLALMIAGLYVVFRHPETLGGLVRQDLSAIDVLKGSIVIVLTIIGVTILLLDSRDKLLQASSLLLIAAGLVLLFVWF